MLTLTLRFTHVVFGALWVGMMAFQVFLLMPALGEAGPDAARLMPALARRNIPTLMLVFAILALGSGFWLFQRMAGGSPAALMATPMGKGFAFGGVVALIAFLLGVTVMRPAMMRSMKLAASHDPAFAQEIQRLRARGTAVGRWVAILLLVTLAAMAVARYL
jgi:uncharacterized membrane protein